MQVNIHPFKRLYAPALVSVQQTIVKYLIFQPC